MTCFINVFFVFQIFEGLNISSSKVSDTFFISNSFLLKLEYFIIFQLISIEESVINIWEFFLKILDLFIARKLKYMSKKILTIINHQKNIHIHKGIFHININIAAGTSNIKLRTGQIDFIIDKKSLSILNFTSCSHIQLYKWNHLSFISFCIFWGIEKEWFVSKSFFFTGLFLVFIFIYCCPLPLGLRERIKVRDNV